MTNNFEKGIIEEILSCPDSVKDYDIDSRIFGLPLSLGENASNDEEYKYAFDILVSLCGRKNAQLRANAILGFACLARKNSKLNKDIVLPLVKKVWRQNGGCRGNIICAVEDINQFLQWDIDINDL
jgi:hypothetical protein